MTESASSVQMKAAAGVGLEEGGRALQRPAGRLERAEIREALGLIR